MTSLKCFGLRTLAAGFIACATLSATNSAHAYALIGGAWPTGNVTMQLQLDATAPATPALPLIDGSTSWNAVAQAAMNDWNNVLASMRCTFGSVTSTSATSKFGDGVNSIIFSNTVYGSTFDQYTLAVTLVDHYDQTDGHPTVRNNEADLIVNNNRTWNSYSGALRSTTDLRRVLLHELGHILGLDHPDKADPVQTVLAIMNSTVSNLYILQNDDINGITYLYGSPLTVPTITSQPATQSASTTGSATFAISVNGGVAPAPKPALLDYVWYFKAAGSSTYLRYPSDNSATLTIASVQAADAGSYYLQLMTPDPAKSVQTTPATLTVNPVVTSSGTALLNVSTRGVAGTGSSTMIAGFVITGSKSKRVLLRAVGPTLGNFGVSGTLADPKLTLVNGSGTTLATSGQTWDDGTGADAATISNVSGSVGAFSLPAGSKDAVILTTVAPGNYTALATSQTGNSGVVLIEAYDADTVHDATSRVANLSTRGYIGTGSNILIAGFSVQGPGPHTYLIRIAGKSLESAPYNVTGTIIDPILTLFKQQDGTSVQLRVDDDWDTPASVQAALNTAFTRSGAFSWPYPSTVNGTRDDTAMQSAMIVTLQPGTYSAQATGNTNDGTTSPTGNALIEIYELQ